MRLVHKWFAKASCFGGAIHNGVVADEGFESGFAGAHGEIEIGTVLGHPFFIEETNAVENFSRNKGSAAIECSRGVQPVEAGLVRGKELVVACLFERHRVDFFDA